MKIVDNELLLPSKQTVTGSNPVAITQNTYLNSKSLIIY